MIRRLTEEERDRILAGAEKYFRELPLGSDVLICRRVREEAGYRIVDSCEGRCFVAHAVGTLAALDCELREILVEVP